MDANQRRLSSSLCIYFRLSNLRLLCYLLHSSVNVNASRYTMSFRLPARALWQSSPKLTLLPRASTLVPRWTRSYATEQQNRTAIVTGSSRGM
jgi:hypothetical protein